MVVLILDEATLPLIPKGGLMPDLSVLDCNAKTLNAPIGSCSIILRCRLAFIQMPIACEAATNQRC
jgi:hypothetical protein